MTAVKQLHSAPNTESNQIIDYLRSVGLFKDLHGDSHALQMLAEVIVDQKYPAEHAILTEGEEGTELFILVEGQVSVYKQTPEGDEYKVAILDGSKRIVFGESGLIEAEKRTATIRTDNPCRCLVLKRDAFEKFGKDYPAWALPIYRRIAHGVMTRLRKTNDDMLLLYNALVDEIRGH